MPFILAAMILLGGCAAAQIPEEPKQEERYSQEAVDVARVHFKDYMSFNYGQTSWYGNLKTFGINPNENGELVLGIVTENKDDYKDIEMAVVLWIDNESALEISELRFIHGNSVVHKRNF